MNSESSFILPPLWSRGSKRDPSLPFGYVSYKTKKTSDGLRDQRQKGQSLVTILNDTKSVDLRWLSFLNVKLFVRSCTESGWETESLFIHPFCFCFCFVYGRRRLSPFLSDLDVRYDFIMTHNGVHGPKTIQRESLDFPRPCQIYGLMVNPFSTHKLSRI